MKQSTPTSPKPVEAKSVLVQGPPGGGKTTFLMQIPDMGFVDADRNLDGPEAFLRKHVKDLSYYYEPVTYKETNGKLVPLKEEECYDQLISVLDEAKSWPCRNITVDGLLNIVEFTIQLVLKEQGAKTMDIRYWGPFQSKIIKMVTKFRALGKNVFLTCHERSIERKVKGAGGKDMMETVLDHYAIEIPSGINERFGGYFTDVWACYPKQLTGSRMGYRVQFNPDEKRKLKNTFGLGDFVEVESGGLIWPLIKEKVEKGLV